MDAYDLIESHSAKWNNLGRKLKVSFNFRKKLNKNNYLTNEERLEEILQKWIELDSEDAPATWSFLTEALKDIEPRSVITGIEKFLKTPKATESYGKFYNKSCSKYVFIGAQLTCILYVHVVSVFSQLYYHCSNVIHAFRHLQE